MTYNVFSLTLNPTHYSLTEGLWWVGMRLLAYFGKRVDSMLSGTHVHV